MASCTSSNTALAPHLSHTDLLTFDQRHIWHPYASIVNPLTNILVTEAKGVYLTLADGRSVVDGMSSWWSAIHGYNHPVLNQAVKMQLDSMAHVMFGGITHPAAIKLAKQLIDMTPAGLDHVFFSDSGSVAVEVAIKMAIQYWYSLKQPQKHKLLTLRGGYHGDTFGAMAVCDPVTGMHHWFRSNLPQHYFADKPRCRFEQPWDDTDILSFQQLIEQHHHELAAVILEPIVQGAGGMWFYSPMYLAKVRELCDAFDVLLIADEIATGFGRTGQLFACEHASIQADIVCLGKALTGGYMSLAATLCSHQVSEGIGQGDAKVLMHGPTFMANPLACATALASIEYLLSQPWQTQVQHIGQKLRQSLVSVKHLPAVRDVRVLGAIGVIEMHQPIDVATVQTQCIDHGVWLRPFGRLLYTMPAYTIIDEALDTITQAMVAIAKGLSG